jgi:hypothetical protein
MRGHTLIPLEQIVSSETGLTVRGTPAREVRERQ